MKRRTIAMLISLFAIICALLSGCDYGTYPTDFEGSKWRAVELDMVFEVGEKFYAVTDVNAFGFWQRGNERLKISISTGRGECDILPTPIQSYSEYYFHAPTKFYTDRFVMDLTEDHTRRVQGDDIPLQLTFIRVDGTPRDHDKWFKSEPAAVLPDRREERA